MRCTPLFCWPTFRYRRSQGYAIWHSLHEGCVCWWVRRSVREAQEGTPADDAPLGAGEEPGWPDFEDNE